MGALGGSFLNHIWLVCACAPVWPDPPRASAREIDAEGRVVEERVSRPRATATTPSTPRSRSSSTTAARPRTCCRPSAPYASAIAYREGRRLGLVFRRLVSRRQAGPHARGGQGLPERSPSSGTISRSPISPDSTRPRNSGRDERTGICKDAAELEADIKSGKLPPVAFYKPIGVLNQHPGYANLVPGDEEVGAIVRLMDESPMKDSYAVIITYDENGGFWDHVRRRTGRRPAPRPTSSGRGRASDDRGLALRAEGHVDHTDTRRPRSCGSSASATGSIRFRARATGQWKVLAKVLEFGQ